ncbi:MAG: hypothetical protein IID32_05840 [Planctomycetes bacterium]|nr:hypothetical protein [Planctomycetota bacterium]
MIKTRRIVEDVTVNPFVLISDTLLSQTVYNTFGQLGYSVDQDGIVTAFTYDELGNVV